MLAGEIKAYKATGYCAPVLDGHKADGIGCNPVAWGEIPFEPQNAFFV